MVRAAHILDRLLLAITSPAPLTDTPKNSTVIQCEECLLLGNGITSLFSTPDYSKYLAFHSADSSRTSVKGGYRVGDYMAEKKRGY